MRFHHYLLPAVGLLLAGETYAAQATRSLSATEMEATKGGVFINILHSENHTSEFDNVYVTATIYSYTLSSVGIEMDVEGTKNNFGTVDTSAPDHTDTYRQRARNFPVCGYQTVTLIPCDTNGENCGSAEPGSDDTNDYRIDPEVKLASARFYQQEVGGTITGDTVAENQDFADNLDVGYYNASTEGFDVISGHCAGAEQWNFRYDETRKFHELTSKGHSEEDCLDIFFDGPSGPDRELFSLESCDDYKATFEEALAAESSTHEEHINFIYVDSINQWDAETESYKGFNGWAPGGNRRWVLIKKDVDRASIYVHEWGHRVGQSHTTTDCSGSEGGRNFMCSAAGREVTTTQCTEVYEDTLFPDLNACP